MKFCQSITAFPAIYKMDEQESNWFKFRKLVGKPIASDISFVFDKSRRLFAHKVLLSAFSPAFRDLLEDNRRLKYLELPSHINEKCFISYLRLIYTNYEQFTKFSKSDIAEIIQIGIHFKDLKLFSKFSSLDFINGENILPLKKLAITNSFTNLNKDLDNYFIQHFDKIIRSDLSDWPSDFIAAAKNLLTQDASKWISYCSWLDLLWFSYHNQNEGLLKTAIDHLCEQINVDNVVSVLISAHTVGAKELRDKCIDFVIENAVSVEIYQRMKLNSEFDVSKVGTLSISVKNHLNSKVKQKVSSLKTDLPSKNTSKVTIFNKKKRTCTLCKRVLELNEIKKDVPLPDIFGYSKPKQLCLSCNSLVSLIN